tara:strand:- start:693 stop:1679 length:987 start_codon:yes stop_codon:yes gene_type:complete
MATNITQYNATAGSNTSIDSINLQEGQMVASDVNNAIRSLMSHLKNVDTGSQALTALSVTGALTVSGAFTSQGIDDNADATAITIDSTERVLINKTSTDFGVEGVELGGADGKIFITRDNTPFYLNRLSSDGNLIQLYRDSTERGSIGVESSKPYFSNGGNFAIRLDNNTLTPANPNGTASDNAENLGSSSARWADLYLGGGVFLGGNGSSNHFQDYEEGTHTITLPNVSFNHQGGNMHYTKVGERVFVNGGVQLPVTSDTNHILLSLPFVPVGNSVGAGFNNGGVNVIYYVNSQGFNIYPSGTFTPKTYASMSSLVIYFGFHYRTLA